MDVHNVAEQHTQMISRQKQTLLEAKKRQGQKPRDRKPREEIYSKFMLALMLHGKKVQQHMIHSSFIPPAYLPCITPLAQLRRVAIKDLQLEIHHRGTYVLLRSPTPPSRMTAIMSIMEDEGGDAIMLQIYQQEDEEIRTATEIVNVGTILLLKEPYFKVTGDGEYGLRVDHLSDIVYLEKGNIIIPTKWQPRVSNAEYSAESLKITGNLAIQEGRYWDAITRYSDALGHPTTENEIEVLKRNRTLAFLKTKQFDAALSDTGFPNFNSNLVEKAMFRAAEALYNLERFLECCEVLELLHTQFPQNNQASVVLAVRKPDSKSKGLGYHATYIGPVEIRQAESKGRGLFVTKAVKAGDLLLCEKAFAHAHVDEGPVDKGQESLKISLLINPETDQAFMGAQADLIRTIVQKLYRNPSIAPDFNNLHHGAYERASTLTADGKPIVDTFLVERIISFNVFGCPVSSLISHIKDRDRQPDPTNQRTKEQGFHSCGIWTHASHINHSCITNARRAFIGNMMIVRATRDIEADAEIAFWYKQPDCTVTSAKKIEKKFKIWDFVCGCALCVDIRATDVAVLSTRTKLIEDLKRAFTSPKLGRVQLEKIERILNMLNQTYTRPAEQVPRLLLWDPYLALARIYGTQNQAGKNLASVRNVLTSLGFVFVGADASRTRFAVLQWGLLMDHLVETFLHARAAFAAWGLVEDSRRAEGYARVTYKIIVGEDSSFDESYG